MNLSSFLDSGSSTLPIALAVVVIVLVPIVLSLVNRKSSKPFLDPANFQPLTLVDKKFITHNTLRLKFALPHPKQRLGLPIGQHITFFAQANGKDVYRAYTPVSDDDCLGCVEFAIKIYPQGQMSQVLNKLEVGQTMLMKGPKGRLQYQPNMKKHIGMLAGGTGVTPMFQVLNAILKNAAADKTQVSLVFGNLTQEDILLKEELDALQLRHPTQLKVYHVLNTPPAGWTMGAGFITPEIIKAHLPAPGPDTLVLQCGPPPMIDAMKRNLEALGYDASMQFTF